MLAPTQVFELQCHYLRCQVECAQTRHLPLSIRSLSEEPLILFQPVESSKRTSGRGSSNPNISGVLYSTICDWLVDDTARREVTGAGLIMVNDVRSIMLPSKRRLDKSKSRMSRKD